MTCWSSKGLSRRWDFLGSSVDTMIRRRMSLLISFITKPPFGLSWNSVSAHLRPIQWVTYIVHGTHKLSNSVIFFFKIGSYDTIHIFKNYFATMFSVLGCHDPSLWNNQGHCLPSAFKGRGCINHRSMSYLLPPIVFCLCSTRHTK